MPVFLAEGGESVEDFINSGSIEVANRQQNQTVYVPVRQLVTISNGEELKNIVAGKTGEYVPVDFYGVNDGARLSQTIQTKVDREKFWDVEFAGSFFANKEMILQLAVILMISLALMYFILCAQFESFRQPLIVLLEIPIDMAFALLVLWLSGMTLNLMSGIGIIVSCGIIVNDSILKIDTINELRKSGMPLHDAVHTAGLRRLRAIIMTSLTTIGAMLPVLFTADMGSELQQPLAVAMIASMTIGTVVSLFVIPLIYIKIEERRASLSINENESAARR
jgi:multidrug efflux pump subunit AcrB